MRGNGPETTVVPQLFAALAAVAGADGMSVRVSGVIEVRTSSAFKGDVWGVSRRGSEIDIYFNPDVPPAPDARKDDYYVYTISDTQTTFRSYNLSDSTQTPVTGLGWSGLALDADHDVHYLLFVQ